MSQINLKSITGITSITTPAGVDNVFTVHSNDTTERFRVDSNGNQVIAGILTVTQDLDVDGHTELDNTNIVGIVTVTNSASGVGLKLIDASSKQFVAGGGGGGTPFAGSFTGHDFRIQVGGLQNAIFKYASGATGNLELGPSSGIGITFNGATGNAGYAGIVTATTFVGNGDFVELDVDGHTNLDNVSVAGVVTATSFVGGLPITNGADNRVITASSASAIQGEASLQFDGTRLGIGGAPNNIALDITKNQQGGLRITDTSVSNASFEIRPQTGNSTKMFRITDVSANSDRFNISASGNVGISSQYPTGKFDIALGGNSYIKFGQDADNPKMEWFRSTGNASNTHYSFEIQQILGNLTISTAAAADLGSHSYEEKLRIDSSGRVIIGATSVSPATSYTDNLVVSEASANAGIQIIGNNSNSNYATFGLGDAGGNLRSYLEAQLGANGNFTIGTAGTGNIRFLNSGGERLRIDGNGNIAHNSSGSGISYFKGSSEYIFGSNTSSPPAGGSEANVQIHTSKTRASFSINAYMNNAGGPFMQFVTSRSGTVGTLGTKVQSNDYLGEIRFMGDNATNYNSLAHGATIWARAKSTPADGDTVIHGELNFAVGTTDGTDGVKDRLTIQDSGRIKFHEDPVQRNSTVDNFTGDGAYMQHYVARTGSQYRRNLDIASVGDGSWGSSIRFSTNSDSNATTAERMRLNHNGELAIGGDYTQTTHRFLVDNGTTLFKSRVFVRGTMSFNSTPFGANVTYDTGISVNAGGYGGSILAICSKNYGSGTNTQSGVYLIKFHYDGNNTPSITLIAGSNLATFAQSASNTLTVAMGASNNMFTAIESSVVPT